MPPAGMHSRLLHPVAVRPGPLRGLVKLLVVPAAGVVDFGALLVWLLWLRRRLREGGTRGQHSRSNGGCGDLQYLHFVFTFK